MDIIDNYYCPMCAGELKRTIRNSVLYRVDCKCGYRSKSTFSEIDKCKAIIAFSNNYNLYLNRFKELTKIT